MRTIMQSNAITSARYEFTLFEKRIIYLVARRLNGVTSVNLFKEYICHIPIKEVLKSTSNNYDSLKDAATRLYHRGVQLKTIDEATGKKCWTYTGLINGARILEGTGQLEVSVHPDMVPHYANLFDTPQVTVLNLDNALSLKSIYSQRLYELMSRFKDTGWYKVSVQELREQLKMENKYQKWGVFSKKVIGTAEKELKEKSDVWFKVTPVKTGRCITHLTFRIFTRSQDQLNDEKSYNLYYTKFREPLEKLGLSSSQIKRICRQVPEKDISRTIYQIRQACQSSTIKKVGAYTWSVFSKAFFQHQNAA